MVDTKKLSTTPSPSSKRRGNSRKVITIVGPTASGKTGIGVKLAKEFNGEIVSADSRQVYRGLDLGTGKEGTLAEVAEISKSEFLISKQISNPKSQIPKCKAKNNFTAPNPSLERRGIEQLRSNLRYIDDVPQWMIDIVEPGEKMTLFDYLPLARAAIEDILSRGKLPIIVGGTGLYVQGIVEGFELEQSQVPSTEYRGFSREQLENKTTEELNQILLKINSDKHNAVDQKNRHRLIRAIELAQEGLKPTKVKPDFETLQIAIDLPRKELFERIDRRVDERFEAGMLDEVVSLLNLGVSDEWLMNLGLEYKLITQFLVSGITYNVLGDKPHNTLYEIRNTNEFVAMKQDLKYKSHQFARRQLTWLRRFPEVNWLAPTPSNSPSGRGRTAPTPPIRLSSTSLRTGSSLPSGRGGTSDYSEIERFAKIFLEH